MKRKNKRERNLRKLLKLVETENILVRALSCNQILDSSTRSLIPSPSFFESKLRNNCILTGRSRSIIKDLGISHKEFRRLSDKGMITGWRRSTW